MKFFSQKFEKNDESNSQQDEMAINICLWCRFTHRCVLHSSERDLVEKCSWKICETHFDRIGNIISQRYSDVQPFYRANVTLEPPLHCLDRVTLDFLPRPSFSRIPLLFFIRASRDFPVCRSWSVIKISGIKVVAKLIQKSWFWMK